VRTLVISDLHLGGRLGHDVLRRPEPLHRLLRSLQDVERLVLLGDIVELMEGRAQEAMAVAEPVLREVAGALSREAEVVVVPGNHDRPMVREWLRAHRSSLAVDTSIPLGASRTLSRVISWFSPLAVRAHYPGVWLSDRVWATHGHYLDRHLMPVSAYGVTRGLLSRRPRDGALPREYERARRPSASRATRWLPRPAAALVDEIADVMRAATMPNARRHLLRPPLAPVNSRLLGLQMRRAAIPAFSRVVQRLGVNAEWTIFGHVHRLGPLADDDPTEWEGPSGRPRVANTGSWLYEPVLLHRATPPHPYWPGGAVLLDGDQPPRAIGLLDDLSREALQGR
jgi:hypothetical protein